MKLLGQEQVARLHVLNLVICDLTLHDEHVLVLLAQSVALLQRHRVDATCKTLWDPEYSMGIVEQS